MEFGPIIRAMLRNKPGFVLIALQIAVTMAIMINAVAIVQARSALMSRPSGVDEANIFYLSSRLFRPDIDQRALFDSDLDAIRNTPGVVDAFSSNSVPLRGGGWSMELQTEPGDAIEGVGTAIYFADEHGIDTLGTRLVAGRNFRPEEILWNDPDSNQWPAQGIVTAALAEAVFPDLDHNEIVGRTAYIDNNDPVQIIGILDRLQTPWSGWDIIERSMLVPQKRESDLVRYVIRTEPGQRDRLMPDIEEMLAARSRDRIINEVTTMEETRQRSYRDDRAMIRILTFIVSLLTVITALGIVGLASFSVNRRRKQIGTRRALGATRYAILRYFMLENLIVSTLGLVVGAILATGLNIWMVDAFGMAPMDWYLVPVAMLTLWLVGQLAVAGPARRASLVPPAVATRTV